VNSDPGSSLAGQTKDEYFGVLAFAQRQSMAIVEGHCVASLEPDATTLEKVLGWGSRNGAELLGLHDVGEIKVGVAADLVLYDINQPRFAGIHSPLTAPLMCGEPVSVKYSFVQGRPAIENGDVCGLDEAELTARVQESVA